MGELQVPAEALWGAQTQRAVQNFPISGQPMPREFIRALGLIKAAAAAGQRRLRPARQGRGAGDPGRPRCSVAEGEHDAQFPIDVFQTGSGTSSNMNANEVIATLATRGGKAQGPSERPRQPRPEFQRRDPDRDPGIGAAGHRRAPAAGAQAPAPDHRAPRQGVGQGDQDRPHPSDGRDAADVRPGVRRLVLAVGLGAGAHRRRAQAPAPAADRRHRDRHRHQRRSALRQGDGARRCRR